MSCRLKDKVKEEGVEMNDLLGGQMAVLLNGDRKGQIVTRDASGEFTLLGVRSIHNGKQANGYGSKCSARVRVLEPGELIEVRYS